MLRAYQELRKLIRIWLGALLETTGSFSRAYFRRLKVSGVCQKFIGSFSGAFQLSLRSSWGKGLVK